MLTSASVFQSASVAGRTQQLFQPCGKPRTLCAMRKRHLKQMRLLITTWFCLLFLCSAKAQESKQSQESPNDYFNNFQKYSDTQPNADSAFYYVRKLASNDKYVFLLKELLHLSFAQAFIPKEVNDTNALNHQLLNKEILKKIVSDTTKLLLETAKPMYLWIKAQDNKNDLSALTKITNEFIKEELSSGDIYKNSVGRYGLMIYQIISEKTTLKPLAGKLFTIIYSNLKNNQVTTTDSSSRTDLDKRAWYRYLYAYVNYIKAKQTDDINEKGKYLKTAFDYSPDIIDKNHYSAYFYDMIFLFSGEEKPTFKPDYLEFLTNTSFDKQKTLALFLETALVEPEYKNKLENFYNNNNKTATSFDEYWRDAINSNAKAAPPVLLHLLNQKIFSSKQYLGKWILIDFWGTWCLPCRAEHPEMQKFYDSVVLKNSKNISLLTIACRDTREKVVAYLKEKRFTFPVAMSDGKIENIYPVQGYPTKILITPEGKYLTVPYGINWVNFVKQYCNL